MKKRSKGNPEKTAAKVQALKEMYKMDEQTKIDKATYEYGVVEGRRQMKVEVLSLLQTRYLADDAPDKGTPEAEAILSLAADISTETQVIDETKVQPE